MPLPTIGLYINNGMFGLPKKGSLKYQYSPFINLQNPLPDADNPLIGLTINSELANINITEPVDLKAEVSYDDSVNLTVIDRNNSLKIVNSRFYQTSSTTYEIADRKGNLDTNIYSEENFKIEAGLIKSVRTISTLDFLGLKDGGRLPVGSYTFYFKVADADGNESDFIAESGKVVCHIGAVNHPQSIRGGLMDEVSNKLIKFKLNNLDLAYDYINIYYTRTSGSSEEEITKAYRIKDKYKITNNNVDLSITGYEEHIEIDISEINTSYTNFDSVQTLENCQNISFAGNITNNYDLFKTLEKYSLFVIPELAYDEVGIGNLDHLYNESDISNGYEYYNTKNIYYKLGNWDDEIYRYGIVYILNNYTLSPVFNIRGRKIVGLTNDYTHYNLYDDINYSEDYILEGTKDKNNPENIKGVFKISAEEKNTFNNLDSIKPLGIKFKFVNSIVDGDGLFIKGLKDLTKGFFIVRQKRIPTILAQSIGIATSEKAKIPVIKAVSRTEKIGYEYLTQGFLNKRSGEDLPILSPKLFKVDSVIKNALLCPEANLRRNIFNTFFNSSQYILKEFNYSPSNQTFLEYEGSAPNSFTLKGLKENANDVSFSAELTLVEPEIDLIRNSQYEFSSKAGDKNIAYKHLDPNLGSYEDVENEQTDWNTTTSKVRGVYNTFVGTSIASLSHGKYYNILERDYNFEERWQDYFRVRYNDANSFYPVGDRTSWDNMGNYYIEEFGYNEYITGTLFRGDCYINTITHRINWNFIDPEMTTNKKIVDPYTWAKNFRIKRKASKTIEESLGSVVVTNTLSYNKLLDLFTYKDIYEPEFSVGESDPGTSHEIASGLLEPDDKKFKKYSVINGLFGAEKINRPDVNAVPLGQWVTFKICSNVNLALRDLDFSNPQEEAIHRMKRGFYPLQNMDPNNSLPESSVINSGISKTIGEKNYYEIPDVPFIKTNFSTRIYYSNTLQSSAFTNGNRIFKSVNFKDYSKEYGSIIKLVEWFNSLIVVLEHGVFIIPVNERAAMANASGQTVYINTNNVLPENPIVLSHTYGSLWEDSVIKTTRYVYGIDTVGKKIWRTNGKTFEILSDLKIQKFLNDNIKLRESDTDKTVNINFVKSHYNAFKQDVMFIFKYNDVKWNLCWNELTNKWVTQYTWFPEFSENINNIFYTFANRDSHKLADNKLYKHGFAGLEEEQGDIKPAFWYDTQYPFEYEFIVGTVPGVQKIFDTLKIISNFAEPDSFYYEVVGEGFDWMMYKDLILKLNDTTLYSIEDITMSGIPTEKNETNVMLRYARYLDNTTTVKKLPYIYIQSFNVDDADSFYRDRGTIVPPVNMSVLRDVSIREYNKTKEKLVNSYQKGANIKSFGRMRGNMQYLEDAWTIQIQPIIFKYAYMVNNTLTFSNNVEMKIRDKYLKVRVKYDGTQYAIINAIKTLFTISYA